MGMNIAILSPHTNRAGNTTVAALIASELSNRGRTVCLTHTTSKSNSIFSYFGLNSVEDKTSNPHRLVKMLREGAIRPEEVRDYCKPVNKNYDVFSPDIDDFEKTDLLFALDYISTSFPHDFVIYDFDSDDLSGEVETTLLKRVDIAVLVVEPNKLELAKFKNNAKKILSDIGTIPMLVVINNYTGISGSLKEVAGWMGIKKPNRWYTMRYNPYIAWATNTGKLGYLSERMNADDIRVIDIAKDAKNIGNGLLKVKVAKRQATMQKQSANRQKDKAEENAKQKIDTKKKDE